MTPVSNARAHWLARHVLPHEGELRAWLRRRLPRGFDLDDIVQETYAVLAAKASIDTIRNPRTYSFQVAHSVVLQQLRHARVVPIAAVADTAMLDDAAIDEPSPEQAVVARDELARIRSAIDALPRQTRQAFVMRRVDGLSQQEIARRMNLSEHTVEKHIARGIKSLLSQFGRGGKPQPDASRGKTASGRSGEPAKGDIRGPETRDDETNRQFH